MKIFKHVLLILFVIFMCIFTKIYLSMESPLYTCDCSEYSFLYFDYAKLICTDFKAFLSNFAYEICNFNRNPFLNIFLFPFYIFFRESRYGYIIAINIMFMIPSMLILFRLINSSLIEDNQYLQGTFSKRAADILLYLAIAFVIFLYPSFWHTSLNAIPDICGMVPVGLAFIVYYKYGFDKKVSWKVILLTAFLLYFSFLLRRWYSVVILSFLLSVFLQNLIEAFFNVDNIKSFYKKNLFTILNLSIISLIILAFAILIQTGYVINGLMSEMHERSLYIVSYNQWKVILKYHIGTIYQILAAAGIIWGYKNRLIRFAALNLFIYLSLYIFIMNNQFIWINHNLFPAFLIVILIGSGIINLTKLIKINIIKSLLLILIIIYSCFNFTVYFLPVNTHGYWRIFPATTAHPNKSDNFSEIRDVYLYLKNDYEKNNDIKVAIYGTNQYIGYWQFRSLDPASNFAKNNILPETVEDSSFNGSEINADFVLIITPLDLYFDDYSICRVLTETQNMFLEGNGIAINYSLIKDFYLNDKNNTNIKLYKRNKPLSEKQIKNYIEHFYQYYPEWKDSDLLKNCLKN